MKGGFVAGDAQQYLEECINYLPTLGRKKWCFLMIFRSESTITYPNCNAGNNFPNYIEDIVLYVCIYHLGVLYMQACLYMLIVGM